MLSEGYIEKVRLVQYSGVVFQTKIGPRKTRIRDIRDDEISKFKLVRVSAKEFFDAVLSGKKSLVRWMERWVNKEEALAYTFEHSFLFNIIWAKHIVLKYNVDVTCLSEYDRKRLFQHILKYYKTDYQRRYMSVYNFDYDYLKDRLKVT
jgi:hypothetical protein